MCTLSVELDMAVQETATIENNWDEHAPVLKASGGKSLHLQEWFIAQGHAGTFQVQVPINLGQSGSSSTSRQPLVVEAPLARQPPVVDAPLADLTSPLQHVENDQLDLMVLTPPPTKKRLVTAGCLPVLPPGDSASCH